MDNQKPRVWLIIPLCAVLFLGTGLAIAYFNADVSMSGALSRVFAFITGETAPKPASYAIPYSIGVALGVLVFLRPPFSKNPPPLWVKFSSYKADVESCKKAEKNK